MSKMALGYGSEFHLLRMLGRHREYFNNSILMKLGCEGMRINWLDFNFAKEAEFYDSELKGIEFLDNYNIKREWRKFWPQTGNPQNWDAVGLLCNGTDSNSEYILVEAKAHLEELSSLSGASGNSMNKIKLTFELIQKKIKINSVNDWTKAYYQLANRIAFLYFMNEVVHLKAKLINVFFLNDVENGKRLCPRRVEQWKKRLETEYDYLGIKNNDFVASHIYNLFLRVDGQ